MKTLILGGNRFIGKQLSHKLSVHRAWDYDLYTLTPGGNEVDVFNRSGTGIPGVNIIQGDRNNKEDLKKIDFNKYDSIVDMCLYKLEQFNLIKDLIPTNINYVFVSSGAVAPLHKKHFGDYAKEKIKVEGALFKSNINYKIVRPSYIVGKGDPHSRLEYYTKSQISVDGGKKGAKTVINLVFVQDVVNCLVKLSEDLSKTNEIYYICGENLSINEIVVMIKKELQMEPFHIPFTAPDSKDVPFKNFPFKFTYSQKTKITDHYGVLIPNFTDRVKEYINEEHFNEIL